MKLTVNRNFDDVQFCDWDLVRGEREELRVAFQGGAPDDAVLTFAAKESRDATGFVLYCDEFVREGDEFVAVVVLNTVELNGLVAGRNAVQLVAELRLETGRITQKFVLKLAVRNDVIKGDEGLPVPAPEFVTKVYLAEELRKHSADMEAVADRTEGFADAAANGAAAAAGSEALARKWATNPKDAVVEGSGATVKFSAKHWSAYAQQYARNASDSEVAAAAARLDCELFRDCAYNQSVASAKSATVSTEQAKIAADLVAGVAGVGEQVTAVQNAAATAASKATEAVNSATAADNSATAAGNSKTAAASSASAAARSETNAGNSAKAAADSKTACEGILAQMQGLLNKVVTTDNIASHAVTSFGGKKGAISVGSNLSMSGSTLNASGGGGGGVTSVNGQTGDVLLGLSAVVGSVDLVEATIVASQNTSGKTTGGPLVFGYSLPLQAEAISPTGEIIDTLGTAITTENSDQYVVTSFNGSKGDVNYSYSLPSNVVTTGNIAFYAVTSFGGKKGAISVGSNLSMSGAILNASGGGGGGGGVTSVNGLTGAIELRLGNMPHPEDGSVSALYIFANDEYGNEGVASDRYMMGLKGASYGPYTQCFDFTGI